MVGERRLEKIKNRMKFLHSNRMPGIFEKLWFRIIYCNNGGAFASIHDLFDKISAMYSPRGIFEA